MFAIVPVFNSGSSTSENHTIQPEMIKDVAPHADVTVGVDTVSCVEVFFSDTHSIIVLLDMDTMNQKLAALFGPLDEYGTPL